jgi:hypothetical protein
MVRAPDHFFFGVRFMKTIVAVPVALLAIGMLGCAQQHSTAPAVQTPAANNAKSSDTNMFGENKGDAAGNAASARAANYGTEPAPAADATPPASGQADSAPPK